MSEVREVNISEIKVNPYQPRSYFDDEAIQALAESIKENGLVQPITLRKVDDFYELIAGERRLRACMKLGLTAVPANIVEKSGEQSMYMSLIENIQREDLSSIEEAKAYLRIMQLNSMTQSELAEKIGKSQPSIANKIRLLNLNINVQNAVEAKLISERHARAMLSLDKEEQNKVLDKVIKDNLTVSETEKLIKPKKIKPKTTTKGYSRNVQIGINTIKRAVEMVEKSGLNINMSESDEGNEVKIVIKIIK